MAAEFNPSVDELRKGQVIVIRWNDMFAVAIFLVATKFGAEVWAISPNTGLWTKFEVAREHVVRVLPGFAGHHYGGIE